MKITVFKNAYEAKIPYYVDIATVYERIRTGKSKYLIEKIRAISDKSERDLLKAQLPAIVFGGEFSARNSQSCSKQSKMIVIDVDRIKGGLAPLKSLKIAISKLSWVHAVFISPSGDGLKIVVRLSTENHLGHFLRLEKFFKTEFDINIDKSCKDLARICYESYDPEIYININCDAFTEVHVVTETVSERVSMTATKPITDYDRIYDNLKLWANKKLNFIAGERHPYLVRLVAGCNKFGIPKEIAHSYICYDFVDGAANFTRKEFEKILDYIYSKFAGDFGTKQFDEKSGYAFDIASQKSVYDTDVFDFEDSEALGVRDFIYLGDIEEDSIENYLNGSLQAENTHFPELDKLYKLRKGEVTLIGGHGNSGKALALNTEIPTPYGWTTMGEIKIGDKIFDEKGNVCTVTNATDIMYNRDCYEIVFMDGTKVIADGEHLWNTHTINSRVSKRAKRKRENNGKPKFTSWNQEHKMTVEKTRTTKEILNTLYVKRKDGRVMNNHSIDLALPLQLKDADLEIHPYVLGAWLGDGTSASAQITCNDIEIINEIQRLGHECKKNKAKFSYGIKDLQVKLRLMGLLNNKHIPMKYLRGSEFQRMELLKGLMDTDGYIDKNGTCEFTTIKNNLAQQTYELITSLGFKATILEGYATLYGRIVSRKYRVCFKPFKPVFKLKRKLQRCSTKVKCKYRYICEVNKVDSVPVRCISVDSPNQLYLITKSFIPTHNTTFLFQLLVTRAVKNNERFAIFSPETYPAVHFYNDLIAIYLGQAVEFEYTVRCTLAEYKKGLDFIKDHFFYLFPETDSPTSSLILKRFQEAVIKHKVDGVVIDPFNQMDREFAKQTRDDQFIGAVLTDFKRFATINNVYFWIIAHPNTKVGVKDKDGEYPCPDVYDFAGGAVWNAKVDNVLIYYRPDFNKDPQSSRCQIFTKKIKRKTVGTRGMVEMNYIYKKRRFFINGFNPLEKELYNPLNEYSDTSVTDKPVTINNINYEDMFEKEFDNKNTPF